MRRASALLLLAVVTAAAAHAQNADDRANSARASVRRFVLAYVEAQNTLATQSAAAMWSERAGATSIGQGELTRGIEAIRGNLARRREVPSTGQLSLGSIEVELLGDGGAVAVAPFKTAAPGSAVAGALTLVLEKSGGSWRLVHEHASAQAYLVGN